jgi:hypothetical protein
VADPLTFHAALCDVVKQGKTGNDVCQFRQLK